MIRGEIIQRVIPTLLFGLLLVTSAAIALHAVGFQMAIFGDPETHARFPSMPIARTLHILAGGTVVLIGGFQFSQR
ncbi:MAG: hypothetical protein P8L31_03280 [Pseudomonadales bacterium]|nr:hypothetical protein [Pseudomonadales bacterium]